MRELSEIPAAILVGGLGTRLRDRVPDRPKALADIARRPFLNYQLDWLAQAGIATVILCTGYRGGQIQRTFGGAYRDLRLRYSHEPTPRGTAGALRYALPLLDAEVVLAMNGDVFCEADLGAFWAWHRRRAAAASIALSRVEDTSRYGRVRVDRAGRVQEFEEKSAGGPGWVNAGLYLLSRRVIAQIPSGRPVSIEHDIFPKCVGRGLYGYRSRGRFLDIGTPERYRAAAAFVRDMAAA